MGSYSQDYMAVGFLGKYVNLILILKQHYCRTVNEEFYNSEAVTDICANNFPKLQHLSLSYHYWYPDYQLLSQLHCFVFLSGESLVT